MGFQRLLSAFTMMLVTRYNCCGSNSRSARWRTTYAGSSSFDNDK